MDFLNWYNWITPTNPFASLFFGILFTIILGITVWVETRRLKTVLVTTVTGVIITCIGVAVLNAIGYYA
jgi:type IV secretory pathway VirB6-like protein